MPLLIKSVKMIKHLPSIGNSLHFYFFLNYTILECCHEFINVLYVLYVASSPNFKIPQLIQNKLA